MDRGRAVSRMDRGRAVNRMIGRQSSEQDGRVAVL
jgi:hypothetical protein